jgi:small subunit ribosomal protein S5
MRSVALLGSTIPHKIEAKHGGAKVLLRPASRGTGVIAGGGARAVMEAAGIRDVLSKSLGSSNALNVVLATVKALYALKDPRQVAAMRGLSLSEVSPAWSQSNE